MTAYRNRTRLGLEQIEDRCTPSAAGGGLASPFLAQHGKPPVDAAAHVRATPGPVIPIKIAEQCSANLTTREATAAGFATGLGHWTGRGHIDGVHIDSMADRAAMHGTLTIVTANGDQLFVSFSASWQLSTGKGTESVTVTGGTGRFAGASGGGTLDCTITQDPASPSTFWCNCTGSGTLILPRG
jgi:hypothetical protein